MNKHFLTSERGAPDPWSKYTTLAYDEMRVLRTFSGFKFYYSSVLNGENPYKMIALCLCEGLILGILMKHILCNII